MVNEAGFTCLTAKVALGISKTVKEWRKSERTMVSWMDEWNLPIGVFVGDESDGRIVAQMCRSRGWRVPQDVAIITVKTKKLFAEIFDQHSAA